MKNKKLNRKKMLSKLGKRLAIIVFVVGILSWVGLTTPLKNSLLYWCGLACVLTFIVCR